MQYRVAFTVMSLAFTTLACGQLEDSPGGDYASAPEMHRLELASFETSSGADGTADEVYPDSSIRTDLKLIRTGVLVVRVDDVDSAIERAVAAVELHGGFVSSSQITRDDDGHRHASLTLGIPSERFESALDELEGVGRIERESTDTQDVTKAYFDLETRLGVKRDAEQRLREILRERTGDLSQVLSVEKELARVVEEIERMEGEIRYYDRRIAISTLTLDIYEQDAAIGPGLFSPISDAFAGGLGALAQSVAFMVYLLAFLVPWLALTAITWWVVQSIRGRKKPAPRLGI